MKINKNWEPSTIRCLQCEKDFEVKFEIGTNDNYLPVMNNYNFERILYGHVDEEVLQWINILQVLFFCPHCKASFGSNATCTVCRKPMYHWLGNGTGIVCSSKCNNTYLEWIDNARKRGRSGVIPREAIYGTNNEFSNDDLKNNSRRK